MNDAEILIKFKGDTSDVEKKTKTLKQKLDGTANKISGAASTLAPISGIAAGAIAGITAVSVDFEKSMANVQAISGATTVDMEKLSAKAREMGKATVYSASESADALGYMALAGWKTDDMLEGLPGILNLAAAGNTDLAQTSDIVTDGLTAFGMAAKDSTRFADVMAATMSNSNTTVEMLGESFKYVAPLAGTLGQSIEDTSLALGLMANAGIKSSQAGTSLRQMLSRLSTNTGDARTNLEALGVQVFNSDGTMRSLKDIILETQNAFKGLSEAQQTELAKSIAGQTGMSGFLALVNATKEDTNKLAKAIDNSSGSAQNMADVMNQSTSNQLKIMMSETAELGLQLGEILLPAIRGIIDGITGVVQWFQALSPETQKAILTATLIVAALAPVLAIISNVIKVVGLLSTALNFLAANPIILIIAAVVAVIAIFVKLWNNCEGFRNFFIGMWEGIKTAFNATANFLGTGIQKIIDFFVGLWNKIKDIGEKIKNFFKSLGEGIANVIKAPFNFIISGINAFIRGLNKIKIPDWVPIVGGKGFHINEIPKLNVGTNYVPEDTLAMIHEGEAVVPKKFNPYANGINPQTISSMRGSSKPVINVYASFEQDPLGQMVSNIKTFSGGARNDYNYGMGA